MRCIEERINNLLNFGKNGTYTLTQRDRVTIKDGIKTVELWNNNILTLHTDTENGLNIHFSFCGWESPTTKSRLNSMLKKYGLSFYTKDFETYLCYTDYFVFNGEVKNKIKIDGNKSYCFNTKYFILTAE